MLLLFVVMFIFFAFSFTFRCLFYPHSPLSSVSFCSLYRMIFTYINIHLSIILLSSLRYLVVSALCFWLTKLFLNYSTYLILYALQQRLGQFVPFRLQQLLYLTLKSPFAHVEITNDIVTLIRFIVVAQRALRVDDLLTLRFH